MESKSSVFGDQTVTFSGKVAESGPLRKHQFFLWLKHIIEVPGPPVGHLESSLERCCCAGRLFSRLFAFQGAPGAPQGRKVSPRVPQSLPRDARNPSKIHQKSSLDALGVLRVPGGTPRTEKVTKIEKKRPKMSLKRTRTIGKFASVPSCFSTENATGNPGRVQKKKQTHPEILKIRDSDALPGAGKSRPTRQASRTVPAYRACRDRSRTCQEPSPRHGGGLGA